MHGCSFSARVSSGLYGQESAHALRGNVGRTRVAPAARRPGGPRCGGSCSASTPKLSRSQIEEALRAHPSWSLSEDGTRISRAFVAKNWKAAMEFLNAVSEVAEAENHHPDLHLTGWRNVQVDLQTHEAGGVADIDIRMASKLDEIEVEYSPKWLKARQAQKSA